MRRRYFFILAIVAAAGLFYSAASASEKIKGDFAEIELVLQHSAVAPNSNSAVQIKFNLEKDWHFYADEKTTPDGMSLKVVAEGKGVKFSEPVFPKAQIYFDKVTNQKQDVYSGDFSIFIPFTTNADSQSGEIKVAVKGLACSQQLCNLASYELSKKLEISTSAMMGKPAFSIPDPVAIASGSVALYDMDNPATVLPLAVLAGLLLNIMPCVWPILPIIVMRLVQQAGQSKTKTILLGIAFALGIILFFVALAAVNIILKLGFGMVFQWGDQFRNPAFVVGMALLMFVLALYMFGLFTFSIPMSVGSNKQSSGFAGSVGMGFLAAVLSTPCSFAILTFVLAWAQTQLIPLATLTILLIGVGMALPYVILTSIPKLLDTIPKPGRWMELFKHATGFILLAIGVKLLEAVPAVKIINVLYYSIILAVCIWMWSVCVNYNTPAVKKWLTRLVAAGLAVLFGFALLSEPQKGLIDWQEYDAEIIASAQQGNQPVLIEFTADWCLSCKILDKTVYSSKEVADLLKQKGVLAIKADTTGYDYPAAKAMKEIYSEPAVPVSVLLLPGKEMPIKLRGNMIKAELIRHLQSLQDVKE